MSYATQQLFHYEAVKRHLCYGQHSSPITCKSHIWSYNTFKLMTRIFSKTAVSQYHLQAVIWMIWSTEGWSVEIVVTDNTDWHENITLNMSNDGAVASYVTIVLNHILTVCVNLAQFNSATHYSSLGIQTGSFKPNTNIHVLMSCASNRQTTLGSEVFGKPPVQRK